MQNVKISLAAARVNAKLTQEDVAKSLKVSKKTVINWEKGAVTPSFAILDTLSRLYNMPLDYIFLPTKST
nr:MAG TPA: Helix-turn-helix XRE-family like protein [Caudoviricetes sp.]